MSNFSARLLVFSTSAAILVLEILAGRLLAPYLGVTIETFTGIIGTVLAGISAGAWAGGRAADRYDPMRLLGPLLAVGGGLAMAAPAFVSMFGPSLASPGPVEAVTLAGLAFFLPAAALSAVTPVVVKIRLTALEETGTVVGTLSAVGTAGAIFGTFVTGFVLISAAPSRPIAIVVGAMLAAAGLVLTFKNSRLPTDRTLAVLVPLLGLVAGPLAEVSCDWETPYVCARITVDDARPSGRIVWSNTYRSSYVDLEDPTYLAFRYARNVASVVDVTTPIGPVRALYVGGGGYTLPNYLSATRPGSTNTVLEIDQKLVEIVETELGLEVNGPSTTTVVGDARVQIRGQPSATFDLVVGDAFAGLSVPWHLTTREFLSDIYETLAPGGVYVMNVIDYPPLGFARAEAATFVEVFDHVALVAPPAYLDGNAGGNFVLIGSTSPISEETLRSAVEERDPGSAVIVGDTDLAGFTDGARPLRDDFAPVDQLLSRP